MTYILIFSEKTNSLKVISLSEIEMSSLPLGFRTVAVFDTKNDANTAIGVFRTGQASAPLEILKDSSY